MKQQDSDVVKNISIFMLVRDERFDFVNKHEAY